MSKQANGEKMVDISFDSRYNTHSMPSFFRYSYANYGVRSTGAVEYDSERSYDDVPYLSAQEAPAQERARLPQENGDCQRPQGPVPPQSKGQKKAELLSAGLS